MAEIFKGKNPAFCCPFQKCLYKGFIDTEASFVKDSLKKAMKSDKKFNCHKTFS